MKTSRTRRPRGRARRQRRTPKSSDDDPDETKNPQGEGQEGADDLEARLSKILDAKLNAAITAHMKRATGAIEKTLAEKLAALQTGQAPGTDNGQGQPAGQGTPTGTQGPAARPADPDSIKLREKLEALEKRYAEAEAARKATEDRARREDARGQLRAALDAKGIKGARASAVIALLQEQNALRFDEETGAPLVAVKRARTKGAKAEELVFDDLGAAIDDWSKTTDAAEFLPPPTTTTQARPGTFAGGGARVAKPAPGKGEGRPARPATDAEAAQALTETLEKQGVDLGALFD
jgi:hypothetical protein